MPGVFLPKQASPRSEKATRKSSSTGRTSISLPPRTIMSFYLYPASSEEEGQKYYQASSVSSSEKEGPDYVSPLSLPSLEVRLYMPSKQTLIRRTDKLTYSTTPLISLQLQPDSP